MTAVTEVLLVGGLAWLAYLVFQYWDHAIGTTKRNDARGPRGLPIVGNLFFNISRSGHILEYMAHNRREHGVGASLTIPGIRMWDLSRPDWIEHVQKTNFNNYVKGGLFETIMADVLGQGIFAVDGTLWHVQRKTSSHIFTVGSFKGVISSAIEGCSETLKQIIAQRAKTGAVIDLSNLFFRLTFESFVKMSFGQSPGALTLDTDKPVPFADAFDYAQTRLDSRFNMVIGWRLFERFTRHGRRMKEACKIIDDYAYGLIDARQAEAGSSSENTKEQKQARDLLGLYMDARDENGNPMNRKQLRDAIINLIIAGRDTTAEALSWTAWRITSQKQHIAPMRKEIDGILGPDGVVTYDNYRHLVQVQAVFNEALRLHPSVPKNAKFAINADQIPNGGPRIEPGDGVRWSDWQMARDPDIWGPDCCEFKPSRWIDDEGKLRQFGQFKYHVFNASPRLCLGQNLATFEAVSVIVELVRNFDFDFAPGWWVWILRPISLERALPLTARWESVPKTGGIIPGAEPEPMYLSSVTLQMKAPLLMIARAREGRAAQ